MILIRIAVALMLSIAVSVPAAARQAGSECPPAGSTVEQLRLLKIGKFVVPDAAARRALALALTACLGHPDPEVRDGIAFEALSAWMRAGDLDRATLITVRDTLFSMLKAPDPQGFRRPFAALVLAEVARTDRIKSWMSADERDALVRAAAAYLPTIDDYRAFSDTEGWRHGVAHTADLILQLMLNVEVTKAQLDRLLVAIATQVSPLRIMSYHAGEPERLARPVFFAAQRKLHTDAEWAAWFTELAKPGVAVTWSDSFKSELGLAKRHNLRAFLLSLYVNVRESDDAGVRMMLAPIQGALKQLQ